MSLHIEGYGEWHVGEEFDPVAVVKRVVKFQADGDELDFLLSTLHTYNKKAEVTTLKLDGIDIGQMKLEVYRLMEDVEINNSTFPNLALLAKEGKKSVRSLTLGEASLFFGKGKKILLIKEIKSRHGLGLLEAKMMADGFFRANGWE